MKLTKNEIIIKNQKIADEIKITIKEFKKCIRICKLKCEDIFSMRDIIGVLEQIEGKK